MKTIVLHCWRYHSQLVIGSFIQKNVLSNKQKLKVILNIICYQEGMHAPIVRVIEAKKGKVLKGRAQTDMQ